MRVELSYNRNRPVRFRIWPVLLAGFSTLVVLIAFSGFIVLSRTADSYSLTSRLYTAELRTEQVFGRLRTDILQSAIAVRDELLSPEEANVKRRELRDLENSAQASLATLREMAPVDQKQKLETLAAAVGDYWRLLDEPGSAEFSSRILRTRVVPQRQAVLALAGQIESLTRETLEKQREAIDRRQAELPVYVSGIIGGTIALGLLVAAASLLRISRLETRAEQQHRTVVAAEEDLRRLSQQLVQAQEDERRALSRDLHDQIGQVLTAVRIGIGNVEEALSAPGPVRLGVQGQLDQTKRLAEQALRSVRDIAMGLRPAMLDDLGLEAALEWQVRQFSRLCGVPVQTTMQGDPEAFTEAQRTCIYRVVQEALNNISRHARATHVTLVVASGAEGISVEIGDNGSGFDAAARARGGLGLLGIQERARRLGGRASVESNPGTGTAVRVWLPLVENRRVA